MSPFVGLHHVCFEGGYGFNPHKSRGQGLLLCQWVYNDNVSNMYKIYSKLVTVSLLFLGGFLQMTMTRYARAVIPHVAPAGKHYLIQVKSHSEFWMALLCS